MRPMRASSGMKLMDYYSESFNSASSSLYTAVSTTSRKIGLVFGLFLDSGRIYSIVVNSAINSAGKDYSEMFEA